MLGTLRPRYHSCGKPGCPCATDPARKHGPYWYLVWREGDRWRKRYVPARDLEKVRAAIAARQTVIAAVKDCYRDLAEVKRQLRAMTRR